MKRLNRKISLLTALLLVMALVLTACSETDVAESGPSADAGTTVSQNAADEGIVAGLQAQIAELQAENEALRNQLHQYTDGQAAAEAETESAAQEGTQPAETEGAAETQPEEQPQEDKLNIVVFGDSIWDMDRSDT